jgi:hypothetical protein
MADNNNNGRVSVEELARNAGSGATPESVLPPAGIVGRPSAMTPSTRAEPRPRSPLDALPSQVTPADQQAWGDRRLWGQWLPRYRVPG